MTKAIPFILTVVTLFGVLFAGPATADDATVQQVVFYVQ
jgi:hypothetical protein